MSFLSKFFSAIGSFFEGLFNAAKKTWKKLSPEIQNAMLHGSGIIAIINDNVDKAPPFVIELLQKKYPDLTLDKIKEALKKASEGLEIAEGVNTDDLGALIQVIQGFLNKLQGKAWANISQTLAKGIAAFLAPPDTKFAAISALMEFVFQTFVKKRD